MNGKHLLTSDKKLKHWGYGEWVEEPDLLEFEHEGLKCRIQRIFAKELDGHFSLGHLCGYVCIPKEHSKYGKNAFDEFDEMDIHGGLTYGEFQNDEYWIGFDCAHAGDIVPSIEALNKTMERPEFMKELANDMKERYPNCYLFNSTYKNISFVVGECKALVEQLLNSKLGAER